MPYTVTASKNRYLVLALAAGIILMAFWNVSLRGTSNKSEADNAKQQRELKELRDSVRDVIQERNKQEQEAIKLIQSLTLKDRDNEAEIKKLTKELDDTPFIHTTSDGQRDSLLRAALKN